MKVFHLILLSFLGFSISGCAGLPPLITYLGYVKTAADIGSFLETDKTLTDHALSAITEEDCALFRAVMNEEVCRNKKKKEKVLAKTPEETKEEYQNIRTVDSMVNPNVTIDYSVLDDLPPEESNQNDSRL